MRFKSAKQPFLDIGIQAAVVENMSVLSQLVYEREQAAKARIKGERKTLWAITPVFFLMAANILYLYHDKILSLIGLL